MNKKKLFIFKKNLVNLLKRFLIYLKNGFRQFGETYPNTSQRIQLNFIYFFALIDLIFAILTQIFSLGYLPESLLSSYPFITKILESPFVTIWGSPEKIFFLSYFVIEFMIIRSFFKFSKLIKINILLIFTLLMVQGLAISYWDALFHREISDAVSQWIVDNGFLIATNKTLGAIFFLLTFIGFVAIYFHFYRQALSEKFPKLKNMNWLTDSVYFWLRMKSETMFGK